MILCGGLVFLGFRWVNSKEGGASSFLRGLFINDTWSSLTNPVLGGWSKTGGAWCLLVVLFYMYWGVRYTRWIDPVYTWLQLHSLHRELPSKVFLKSHLKNPKGARSFCDSIKNPNMMPSQIASDQSMSKMNPENGFFKITRKIGFLQNKMAQITNSVNDNT